MRKPANPIVIAGHTLTDKQAWRHAFEDELREQCGGRIDKDWLIAISRTLLRHSPDEDPRRMARLTYPILMVDPEEIGEAEHAASARAMRRSRFH
ncbi:hypothetical protein CKY39_10485 [Variovorax boronicumulans]|uniref:Uncharacterized protein n=1 Tax=Variovorax boronicumulans TaxID=436515 RepID=A0A250DGX6_9BURK|nr:hypothetical protein [Variovorax boronicumulans]ATA53596.1 hypothetical protein CKY39_10485 [Variovorax boronicumulans]